MFVYVDTPVSVWFSCLLGNVVLRKSWWPLTHVKNIFWKPKKWAFLWYATLEILATGAQLTASQSQSHFLVATHYMWKMEKHSINEYAISILFVIESWMLRLWLQWKFVFAFVNKRILRIVFYYIYSLERPGKN